MSENILRIVATDCGSTTTKAILIERNDKGEYRLVARGEAPTTVEKPFEDVTVGVTNSITELEKQIKDQIDVISHLKIHIDEPSDIVYDTRDITANSNELVREVRNILEDCTDVLSSSEIQVVSTNGRIRVSMNCVFKDDYSFDEVHDIVTTLESRIFLNLKNNYPRLANVMIHAEPSDRV